MTMFRNSVVAVIALLLNLQGATAVTMPLCEHGTSESASQADSMQSAGMSHAHHDHGHSVDHDADHNDHKGPASHDNGGLACDDCEYCALSCASTLPCADLVGAASGSSGTPSPTETPLVGVTPHHLSKPPLLV